jgi:hypothetical protein
MSRNLYKLDIEVTSEDPNGTWEHSIYVVASSLREAASVQSSKPGVHMEVVSAELCEDEVFEVRGPYLASL